MPRRQTATFVRALALTLLAGVSMPALAQDDILREGAGQRRTQLNQMELAPFPAKAFDALKDWQNGTAPTLSDLRGKVVLFVTWSDWYQPSVRALNSARRLAERFAKDGVVVIAVHHKDAWAEARKPKSSAEGAQFLLAHDATGEFRSSLLASQDPNFYLVDRAGQMRFASVASESLEAAVTLLVGESADAAAGTRDRLAQEQRAREAEARRTESIRDRLDLTNIPEQPFTQPTPDEYKAARWPRLPRDPNAQPGSTAQEPELRQLALPDSDWYPRKPELAGRAVLVYFWHPDFFFTYENMDQFDRWQREYGRDVVFVGVLTISESIGGQQLTEQQRDENRLKERLRAFAAARRFDHFLVFDSGGAVRGSVPSDQSGTIYPAIASSDRNVRWWGSQNAPDPFAALLQIIRVDPGIKARRAAEEAYIRRLEQQNQGQTPAPSSPR